MAIYTSCFLGIPLPQEYRKEFEKLLLDIQSVDPLIEIVQPQTPHITIYYLNKQSQYSLVEITKLIQPFIKNLKEVKISIRKFDYFTKDNPKVLFLDVKYPKSLTAFKNNVAEALKTYSDLNNDLSFHPHMTVGRTKSASARESFKAVEEKFAVRLNEMHWTFVINEVALYGVDSTKSPEYQEKLATIPVE